MSWSMILHSRKFRGVISIMLTFAIVFGLGFSGFGWNLSQPQNPLDDVRIQDITVLQMGDDSGDEGGIVIPNGNGDAESNTVPPEEDQEETSEPEETEPEETEPEETETTEPETEPEETEETKPEETQPEETEETKPEETESEDTEETKPEETKPQETEPEETKQEDTEPEETEPESTEPNVGPGDEGQEDGNQGEEGGEEAELDIAMVMTWYRYGSEAKTIVCGPSERVTKTLNTVQLTDNVLKYDFEPYGTDADHVEITEVSLAVGDGLFSKVDKKDEITVSIPEGAEYRNYTFIVKAHGEKRDSEGNLVEQDLTFTYVIRCETALDLEMELQWEKTDGSIGKITCAADKAAARTMESHELKKGAFVYLPKLTGTLAEGAELTAAEYRTASGKSGTLNIQGGTLMLEAADDSDEETYYLNFTAVVDVKDDDGKSFEKTVLFTYTLVYRNTLDLELSFTWYEKGITPRNYTCKSGKTISTTIKNNQLSAGAVKYDMELTGSDGEAARIMSVSYQSEGAGSGVLHTNSGNTVSGSLAMVMPEGYSSTSYTLQVEVLAQGQRVTFQVVLFYSSDVTLQMQYSVLENGTAVPKVLTCENKKTKTAEAIYDHQLTNGMLTYTMSIIGDDGSGITIKSVQCYQSGSKKTVSVNASDTVTLLLADGKTGENTFTVTASDSSGQTYEFKINIPYKHKGENSVMIRTNLTDGMLVTNETETNLTVTAWTEDENGNVVSNILATGTDTKLVVQLDGETLSYTSASATAQEYKLIPKNPETGDTNSHTLYIYAEDPYGNFGELTLTLKGQRSQAGQKKGTATLYIDMTVLGLGLQGPVSYEILSNEPTSYVVAKAVWGYDAGDPFGTAKNTFGWHSGHYAGSLDVGFYLQSLSPGGSVNANALSGWNWNAFGGTEEEILTYIDNYFGRGSGLATLWRCLYRNGLNISPGTGSSVGEFDYTSGSGWLYSIGGGAYYPGDSMSAWYLNDGDVLTLRYTLAKGWDVGGGSDYAANRVGYCVTAMNGGFSVNHRMEQVENPDGSLSYVCHCCGMVEDCAHEHKAWKDVGNGTHDEFCEDCQSFVGVPEEHTWVNTDLENKENHICDKCALTLPHNWQEVEGSDTATCTQPGTVTKICGDCPVTMEQESPAKGHQLDATYYIDVENTSEHYQQCQICKEVVNESRGKHQYQFVQYNAGEWDFVCVLCHGGHDWDACGNDQLIEVTKTCKRIDYLCTQCGLSMYRDGVFEDNHSYTDGICIHCGAANPDAETDPTDPDPTDPEPSDPEPSDPEPSDPEPSDPEPSDPEPSDPEPSDPEPSDPEPSDPEPSDPEPSDPEPSNPVPSDPAPSDPGPSDPAPSDPEPSDPVPSDPVPSDPAPSDPVPSDPVPSDPVPSDPVPANEEPFASEPTEQTSE